MLMSINLDFTYRLHSEILYTTQVHVALQTPGPTFVVTLYLP